MAFDAYTIMSRDQALTTAATHPSTDVLDFNPESTQNIGGGQSVRAYVQLTEDFDSAGAATLTVVLQEGVPHASTPDDPDTATWRTVLSTRAFILAELTAGKVVLEATVPAGTERYLRLAYTIGTAAATAGKVFAALTPQR